MTTIKIDPKSREVIFRVRNMDRLYKLAIRKAFHKIGKDLKASASKDILFRPKSGRLYRIKVNGVLINHRASAPGEPPANLTGALRRSLDYKISGATQMRFQAGDNKVDYAATLELGNSRIKQRPYLKKAIEDNQRNINNALNREIRRRAGPKK